MIDHAKRRVRAWAMVGLALAVGVPTAVLAVESPADKALEVGPWWIAANATGRATDKTGGVKFAWDGRIATEMELQVREDGQAVSSWEIGDGRADFSIDGKVEGQHVKAKGHLDYAGGGVVSGTDRRLLLNGKTRTKGTMKVTAAGRSLECGGRVFKCPNSREVVPTVRIRVGSISCDEAWGGWEYAIEQAAYGDFKQQGFDVTVDGFWLGLRELDGLEDHAQELLDIALERGDDARPIVSESYELAVAASLLRRLDDLVEQDPRDVDFDRVMELLADAEAILNALRNLSDCQRERISEKNVHEYENAMTWVIQNLIDHVQEEWSLTADVWQALVHAAFRTGAAGPGAPNREYAIAAEDALIGAAEEILRRNLLPDGGIEITEDTIVVFGEGSMQGWTFEVGGDTYDAMHVWNKNAAKL